MAEGKDGEKAIMPRWRTPISQLCVVEAVTHNTCSTAYIKIGTHVSHMFLSINNPNCYHPAAKPPADAKPDMLKE